MNTIAIPNHNQVVGLSVFPAVEVSCKINNSNMDADLTKLPANQSSSSVGSQSEAKIEV